jgi:hypothetical protein
VSGLTTFPGFDFAAVPQGGPPPSSGADTNAVSVEPPFCVEHQDAGNWCWAAVATSLRNYFAGAVNETQCGLASKIFAPNDCCKNRTSDACNREWDLVAVLKDPPDLCADACNDALLADELPIKLKTANTPIVCRIQWGDFSSHYVVITGCFTGPHGTLQVDVQDPLYRSGTYALDTFTNQYQPQGATQSGSWRQSIFTKSP